MRSNQAKAAITLAFRAEQNDSCAVSSFFTELQRRKVYRVAAAYGVVAWFLIQFSATVFPAWELPFWCLRLVIVLVLSGFPIALLLGWAFEITPTGIHPTAETPRTSSIEKLKRRARGSLLLLAAVGLMVSLLAGFFILPRAFGHRVDNSIAVLPFENLSENKVNAHFADGIQDDILTNLAKISNLRVISRTSVMSYRGNPKSVREIAKALRVSTILEGSAQRDKDRVRLNVQLIDAYSDKHLWAQVYERDLTDVFAIQSELAQKIVSALKATLSPDE